MQTISLSDEQQSPVIFSIFEMISIAADYLILEKMTYFPFEKTTVLIYSKLLKFYLFLGEKKFIQQAIDLQKQ